MISDNRKVLILQKEEKGLVDLAKVSKFVSRDINR